MKVIKLSVFAKKQDCEQGDYLTFAYYEHLSTGITADFEIEDTEILTHIGSETTYDNRSYKELNIKREDLAKTTFMFKALSKGTTLLIIRKYFEAKLEEEYYFRITVV